MRAVVVEEFGPPERIGPSRSIAAPVPGAGQVLIDVHAAGLNFADLLVVRGEYQSLPKPPFVPGKEVAGVIAAVGAGVTRVTAGERVLAYAESGGFAEQAVAAERDCHRLPDGLGFADAASLGLNFQTAHFALTDRARWRAGETVLVTGAAGGVGLASVQMAKALGATVLAGIAGGAKRAAVEAAGADHVVDLSRDDLRNSLREQVYAATGGNGVDVALDPVGGDVFDAALRALAWRGRIVIIGFAAGRIPSIPANYLLVKNIAAVGMYWDSYRKRRPHAIAEAQAAIFALWAEGRIRAPATHPFPLDAFAEAAAALGGRRAEGRVVILPRG